MEASWLWNRQAALREGQLHVSPTRIVLGLFSLLCAGIFLVGGLLEDSLLTTFLGVAAAAVAQPLLYKALCRVTHCRLAIKPRSRVALIVQGLLFLAVVSLLGYHQEPGKLNYLVLILGYALSAAVAIVLSRWVCIPAAKETPKNGK